MSRRMSTTQSVTSGFGATPVNDGEIDLDWYLTVADSSTTIDVQRSTAPTSGFGTIASDLPGDNLFYMDDSAAEGTHYYYRLEVTDSTGTYDSQPVDGWTAPAAPTALQVIGAGSAEVDYSWTNNSGDALGFQIQLADSSGTYQTVDTIYGTYAIGDTVTYTDDTTSAESGTAYRVQTIGDGGLSMPAITGPTSPSDLSATTVSTTELI